MKKKNHNESITCRMNKTIALKESIFIDATEYMEEYHKIKPFWLNERILIQLDINANIQMINNQIKKEINIPELGRLGSITTKQ